jgi:putative hydrolase of the HAD superfamily
MLRCAARVANGQSACRSGNWNSNVAIRAVLFDLGNTLVGYYTSREFPLVLRRCLRECASVLGRTEDPVRDEDLFARALVLNREQSDYAVRPLAARLQELFGADVSLDEAAARALGAAFLQPIFAVARPDPQAVPLLEALRGRGIKTAIVSNTPWGSPADAWRAELARHELLDKVDATVFCMDVGWRKPHRAPFDRALSLLDVAPADALFVGDDHRWDIVGAQNAGLRPVLLEPVAPKPRRECLTVPNLADINALLTEASV